MSKKSNKYKKLKAKCKALDQMNTVYTYALSMVVTDLYKERNLVTDKMQCILGSATLAAKYITEADKATKGGTICPATAEKYEVNIKKTDE